jgi:DNA helicase-2/ATP-dependent DNA helicase PcrA
VRINAQTEAFEEALGSRGIPYVVRGAARFFERPEVRQAVTLLRGTARSRGGGSGGGEDLVAEVRATLAGMGWSSDAPQGRGQARDRWESLQALVDQAVEFGQSADATLNGFVDDLDRRAAEQHAPVADGVTIATLHAAKGLEWDVVFLCGLHEGTVPIVYADTPAAVEEERRLLYVGMTRARRQLCCSWAAARSPGGRGQRRASRFLAGLIPEDVLAPTLTTGGRDRNRRAVACRECGRPLRTGAEKKTRRCADCPASYDEGLFERLRDWRLRRSQDDDVPAFVVFTDATLQLIAEVKPTTNEELLRISGIGRAKLERYGAEVLEVIA